VSLACYLGMCREQKAPMLSGLFNLPTDDGHNAPVLMEWEHVFSLWLLIVAAVIDLMVYDILLLLADRLSGAPMKRHRNQAEMSLTAPSLRPDFWLLVSGTMLFKGQEKTRDNELEAARQDLLTKMKDWDPAYHGTVSLRTWVLCLNRCS
jgi:hypothetical protein